MARQWVKEELKKARPPCAFYYQSVLTLSPLNLGVNPVRNFTQDV